VKDLRYSWFVNLENPWGKKRFADPDNMRTYGFIVDEASPSNPDQLPIGFAKHLDRMVNVPPLAVTCSAAPTGPLGAVSRAIGPGPLDTASGARNGVWRGGSTAPRQRPPHGFDFGGLRGAEVT